MRRSDPGSDLLDWAVSMTRLAGAASLAAVSRLAAPRQRDLDARREPDLDAIRHAAVERMRGPARDLFRLGEQLGRGMVDTGVRFARRPPFVPREVAERTREVWERVTTRRRAAPSPWEDDDA